MLTTSQWTALSKEIDATSTLFRHGFNVLHEYTSDARDAEAVFVCFAGGAEKLLKLTVGLFAIEAGDPWPAKATMKRAGHRITELNTTVIDLIRQRQGRSSAPGLIGELLMVNDDIGIGQILLTLERYAVFGRFHNLDLLGGVLQNDQAPLDLWEELHLMALEANPELLDELADPETAPAALRSMNDLVAHVLGRWCELIRRAWVTGVVGAEAQKWSGPLVLGHPSL